MDVLQGQVQVAEGLPYNMENKALIIFVKNPVPGKVKTRLAKDLGDLKACEVYKHLLLHTRRITKDLLCRKFVFFSDFAEDEGLWDKNIYDMRVQKGGDLGERMFHAINSLFEEGFKEVIIIGSDCIELSSEIINDAFDKLKKYDLVLGPAKDGGYYLLGMKKCYSFLFINKSWSTEKLFGETISVAKKNKLSYAIMPLLSDIDDISDLELVENYTSWFALN